MLNGVALHDFNDNGLDDIVVTTDGDDLIAVIYDDSTMETLLIADDKFKSYLLTYGVELTYPEFEKSWEEMTAEEKFNKSILDARNVPIIP